MSSHPSAITPSALAAPGQTVPTRGATIVNEDDVVRAAQQNARRRLPSGVVFPQREEDFDLWSIFYEVIVSGHTKRAEYHLTVPSTIP